jgi:hypothetical protein
VKVIVRIAAHGMALAVAVVVAAAGPAAASCAEPVPLERSLGEARTAFVGTVVRTSNASRTAAVRVEKIWLGPRLARDVTVHGGPQGAGVASSVDRTYREGERYLFVLDDQGSPFEDNSCSGTTLYTDRIAALEPVGAITPDDGSSFGPWVVVGAALLVAGMLQTRRAMRRAHTMDPGTTV